MRRSLALTLASAAAFGALSFGSAASAAVEPAVAKASAAETASAHRFVTNIECHWAGGEVVGNPWSPTRLSCWGGAFHGYWVYRVYRWRF